jgi:hypothetical protein
MTLNHSPIMRISCRRANGIMFGKQKRTGVLISNEDLRTLRLLSGRDISVTFVCDGRYLYEGEVKSLLRRAVHLPDRKLWYIPATSTGPLKPPRLPPLAE